MASQLRIYSPRKRQRTDAESIDNQTNCGRGGDGGAGGCGNVIIAPSGFTDDLLDIVCSHLPVLSAARMSLVSPRFKGLCKHSKNIVFDESMVRGKERSEVVALVQVAMNRNLGLKINKFSLYINPCGIEPCINYWIKAALHKDVEEIELDFSPFRARWPLDISFYRETSVRRLKLVRISLKGKYGMTGWGSGNMANLRDLRLRHCDLKYFEDVIDFCTSLEYLEIVQCRNLRRLAIDGREHRNLRTLKIGHCLDFEEVHVNLPNLKTFCYQGNIRMITVQSSLERVFVSYKRTRAIVAENLITKAMVHSAKILKVLTVNSVFLEVMYPEFNKGDFAANKSLFPNLTELHAYMENYSYKAAGHLRYLLNRCPRLETLHMDLAHCIGDGKSKELKEKKTVLHTDKNHFNSMKVIKIKGYNTSGQINDFLQFVVARCPALETLALVTSPGSIHLDPLFLSLNEHLRHFALTPVLKISVYDHDNDTSCIFPSQTKSWYLT